MAKVSAFRLANNTREGSTMSTLFVPGGVELYDVKSKGPHQLIVVPYTVPQKAKNPNADDGSLYFERSYWAHRNLGPDGKQTVICPKATFGKRCPICEAREAGKANGSLDKDQIKALYPKHRNLINIYDLAEPEKGVQIWDVSYFLFLQKLIEEAANGEPDAEGVSEDMYFADPVDGKILKIAFTEESFGGNKFWKTSSIRFKSHGGIKPEILEKAQALDSLLVEKTYEEIYAMFHQTELEDEIEETPKTRSAGVKPTKPVEDKVDDDMPFVGFSKGDTVYHAEYGMCTVLKVVDDVITVMDSEDDPHKVNASTLSNKPIESVKVEEVPAEKPKAKSDKSKPKAETKTEEASDDDWDKDWKED